MDKRIYLLTGVTGNVGSEVLKVLLKDEFNTIYCLVRDKDNKSYQQRFDELMDQNGYNSAKKNVIPLKGDIRDKYLGIGQEMYELLCKSLTHIIHCAADIRFNYMLEELKLTNFEGTRNMLELASKCKKDNHGFHVFGYVSSAYIAGQRKNLVMENELTNNFGFHNNYEDTKYEAESLVRSYIQQGIPCIIFRPSVIFGSYETGKILKNCVLFPFLLLFSKMELPTLMPRYGNTILDIVPVDYVAKAICHITKKSSDNLGKCFHLAAGPKKNIRKNKLNKLLIKELSGKNVIYLPSQLWEKLMLLSPKLYKNRKKISMMANFLGYDKYSDGKNPVFSVEQTEKALSGTGITYPQDIKRYIQGCANYAKTNYFNKQA